MQGFKTPSAFWLTLLCTAFTVSSTPSVAAPPPPPRCAEQIDEVCLFSDATRLLDILDRVVRGGEVDPEEKAELIGRMRERMVTAGCQALDRRGASCAGRVLEFVRKQKDQPAWSNRYCSYLEQVASTEGSTPALVFLWASACHFSIVGSPTIEKLEPAPAPEDAEPPSEADPATAVIDAVMERCHETIDDGCLFRDAPALVAIVESLKRGESVDAAEREVLEAEYHDAVLAVGCEQPDAEGWDCAARTLALVARNSGTPLWNNRYCWGLQQRIAEENSPSSIYLWASACRFAGVEQPQPAPPAEPEARASTETATGAEAPAGGGAPEITAEQWAQAEAELSAGTKGESNGGSEVEAVVLDDDGEPLDMTPDWDKNVFIEITGEYIHLWATKGNQGPFTGITETFTLAYCFNYVCLGARGGTLQMLDDEKGEFVEKARLLVSAFLQVCFRGEKWLTYLGGEAGTGIDLFYVKGGLGIRRGFLERGYFSLGANYTSHFQGWPGHGIAAEAGLGFSW